MAYKNVVGTLGVFAVVVASALIASGIPLGAVVPPVSTVIAIIALPIIVVGGSAVLSVLANATRPVAEPPAVRQAPAAHDGRPLVSRFEVSEPLAG